jgi:hypothetical protein
MTGGQWFSVNGGKQCGDHIFFSRSATSDELAVPLSQVQALKISQPPIDDARPVHFNPWAE